MPPSRLSRVSVRPFHAPRPLPSRPSRRQNGQTDVAARFAGARRRPLWPIRPPDTAVPAHVPPTPPPMGFAAIQTTSPQIFLFFIFHSSPFLFFLIPVSCCFSVYIVFSFICPFFFDFSRSFVAADSFPICCRDMRLNRRFRVCAYYVGCLSTFVNVAFIGVAHIVSRYCYVFIVYFPVFCPLFAFCGHFTLSLIVSLSALVFVA